MPRSPFPGMDPFLENGSWSDFHVNMLVFLKGCLQRSLPPGFTARTKERLYIVPDEREIRPDVTLFVVSGNQKASASSVATAPRITPPEVILRPSKRVIERFIEIRDSELEVVTVIEFLSPSNKEKRSFSHEEYLKKQKSVLESTANLIEIDLLRRGTHTVCVPEREIALLGSFDYLVTRADAEDRDRFYAWRISLRERLPVISVPLTLEAGEVELDLQEAFERAWDESDYGATIDYSAPLEPPLSEEDAAWVAERVNLRT